MKTPSHTFREHVRALTDAARWAAGVDLHAQGGVLDRRRMRGATEFRVANDAGRFEKVNIRFGHGEIGARCSCLDRTFGLCPHTIAALLSWQSEHSDQAEKLAQAASVQPIEDEPEAPETVMTPTPDPDAAITQSTSQLNLPGAGSVFGLIRPPRARLEFRLRGGFPSVATRWDRITLAPEIVTAERRYKGPANIVRLAHDHTAAGGLSLDHFSTQDQALIRFLTERGQPAGSEYIMTGTDAGDFLACACGHPRVSCDAGPVVIGGAFVEPILVLEPGGGERRLTPGLLVPTHGLLPVDPLLPVIGRTGTWIGLNGLYGQLAGSLDRGTLEWFLSGQGADLARSRIISLMQAAAQGRSALRILPRAKLHEIRLSKAALRPVLGLDWQGQKVTATLSFRYGRVEIVPESTPPCCFRRHCLLTRDPTAEAAAVKQLRDLGFVPDMAGERAAYSLRNPDLLWQFLHGLPKDYRGWTVRPTPEFSARRDRVVEADIQVLTGTVQRESVEVSPIIIGRDGDPVDWPLFPEDNGPAATCFLTASGDLVRLSDEAIRACELLREYGTPGAQGTVRLSRYALPGMMRILGPRLRGPLRDSWLRLTHELSRPARPDEGRIAHPISDRLREYQRIGAAWIQRLEDAGFHGILADEMGLGKTVQALALLVRRHLLEGVREPSLVICPSSLVDNWVMEAARFAPDLRTVAVRGPDRVPLIDELKHTHLGVTSYALLRRDAGAYAAMALDYVILDEAQHIKNPRTANARACKGLECKHRLILTGTPIENGPREIWSLMDFLLPGLLGPEREFRRRTEQGMDAASMTLIQSFLLRRTKDAVAPELPPKQEQILFCEPAPEQAALYRSFLDGSQALVRQAAETGWRTGRFHILALLTRLRQVCCHPGILGSELLDGTAPETVASAKTALLKEVILEALDSRHKMLIFSQFTSFLRLFKPWLEAEDIAFEYLDGQTCDRQARVDRFNSDPAIPVFLMSLRAGGTGLNLTGADLVIHYDSWWNPMVEDQASDRAHRIGQTRPVTILKLVTRGTIEEKVLALQAQKRGLFDQVVGGAPTGLGALTAEDFALLFEEDPGIGTPLT